MKTPKEPREDRVSNADWRVLDRLRDRGFAVIVWTPAELKGANPSRVQDRSIEIGWDIIEMLSDE